MSLDKWLKPTKKEEELEKLKEDKKEKGEKKEKQIRKKPKVPPDTLKKDDATLITQKDKLKTYSKFILTCSKKCGYQKIKVKKKLTELDKICPRCKGQMNVKNV